MVERALYDFAEAAMGRNSEMRWSLSEAILRRQISPVIKCCSTGELTTEQALDVALDFVGARLANTMEIFTELFRTLENKIDIQMHGEHFPTLLTLEEFFMGLDSDTEWVTNSEVARREMRPVFQKVALGSMGTNEALAVFCGNVSAKRDYYLDTVQGLAVALTEEVVMVMEGVPPLSIPDAPDSGESDEDGERVNDGDD